jgi:hypothetical protein
MERRREAAFAPESFTGLPCWFDSMAHCYPAAPGKDGIQLRPRPARDGIIELPPLCGSLPKILSDTNRDRSPMLSLGSHCCCLSGNIRWSEQ